MIKWFFRDIERGDDTPNLRFFTWGAGDTPVSRSCQKHRCVQNSEGYAEVTWANQKPCRCCRCCVRLVGIALAGLFHGGSQGSANSCTCYLMYLGKGNGGRFLFMLKKSKDSPYHPTSSCSTSLHFTPDGFTYINIQLIRKLLTPEWRCFFFKNILGDSWSPSSASCCFQALAQQHPSLLLEHHQLCDFLEWAVWSLAEFGTVIRSLESMPKLQFNYQTPDLRACLQGSPAFTFSLTRHIIDPFDPVCVQTSDGTPRFFRKFSSAEFHLEFTFCGLFWEVSFAPCPAVRYT